MPSKQPTIMNKATARRRARAISQRDQELLQTLQRSILQTTNYLSSDYTGTMLITPNPDPKATTSLPTLTLRKDNGFLVYSHALLPTTLHPVLNRLYVPHKAFLADQDYTLDPADALRERRLWVGMDLGYCGAYRTPEDFFDALDCAIEDPDATFAVEYPERAGVRTASMMEVRGYFRDREDVLVAASRHVDLLDQLVAGGYIVPGREVLGSHGGLSV